MCVLMFHKANTSSSVSLIHHDECNSVLNMSLTVMGDSGNASPMFPIFRAASMSATSSSSSSIGSPDFPTAASSLTSSLTSSTASMSDSQPSSLSKPYIVTLSSVSPTPTDTSASRTTSNGSLRGLDRHALIIFLAVILNVMPMLLL